MKNHFLFSIIPGSVLIASGTSLTGQIKTDLDVQEQTLGGSTKTYSLVVGQSLSTSLKNFGLKITYTAHSQSMTNYRQNGVRLRLIKSGQVIAERVDQYTQVISENNGLPDNGIHSADGLSRMPNF
ncbi:MAG: hypothetical protein U1F76_07920 [Candidatus Competibacteraceae bacterium]